MTVPKLQLKKLLSGYESNIDDVGKCAR